MTVINFEEAKARIAKMAQGPGLDPELKRRIIISEMKKNALESAAGFTVFDYKGKESYAKKFVLSTLLEIEGGADLFSELEIEILQRAYLAIMEGEQFFANIAMKRWQET